MRLPKSRQQGYLVGFLLKVFSNAIHVAEVPAISEQSATTKQADESAHLVDAADVGFVVVKSIVFTVDELAAVEQGANQSAHKAGVGLDFGSVIG